LLAPNTFFGLKISKILGWAANPPLLEELTTLFRAIARFQGGRGREGQGRRKGK